MSPPLFPTPSSSLSRCLSFYLLSYLSQVSRSLSLPIALCRKKSRVLRDRHRDRGHFSRTRVSVARDTVAWNQPKRSRPSVSSSGSFLQIKKKNTISTQPRLSNIDTIRNAANTYPYPCARFGNGYGTTRSSACQKQDGGPGSSRELRNPVVTSARVEGTLRE